MISAVLASGSERHAPLVELVRHQDHRMTMDSLSVESVNAAVIPGGNLIQMFIVLPAFLLARGINPLWVFRGMLPAVLTAFFTKSSAATLPVTVESAENNLKAKKEVARFVLPICCTVNMNGCAAFILTTSLFVMQNGGMTLSWLVVVLWVLIS